MTVQTVLVVDDEPVLRNLLSHLLDLEGYEVLEAEDGLTALDVVATEKPDLVLLDVMLPARSGLDVLGDLRRTSDVPVILVSARAEEGDRVSGLRFVVEVAVRRHGDRARAPPPPQDRGRPGQPSLDHDRPGRGVPLRAVTAGGAGGRLRPICRICPYGPPGSEAEPRLPGR